LFNESFSTLFWYLYFFPLLYFPFYKIVFFFIINHLYELFCHLQNNVYKILGNLDYKIVKLDLNFAYEGVFYKLLIDDNESVENGFWIFLSQKLLHSIWGDNNWIWHIKRFLLIKLHILKLYLI
jgi:hypothetical protein